MLRPGVPTRVIAALTQAGPQGTTQREIASAIGRRDSSVQRALRTLMRDGVVARSTSGGRSRYRLDARPPTSDLRVELALNEIPLAELARVLARANPEIEFASLGRVAKASATLTVVYRSTADPTLALGLVSALRRLRGRPTVRLSEFDHDDLVDRLLDEPGPRDVARAGTILKGTIARSFPDRSRHGDPLRARRLGRPHPTFRLPSRRSLRRLVDRHGLSDLSLFGSAVRSDLRPDSDIDVLVRYRPDHVRTLEGALALERELASLFDRDIDLVDERRLPEAIRHTIERERVSLIG